MSKNLSSVIELEQRVSELHTTLKELQLALSTANKNIKAGSLAVVTRGLNTDRIFFVTRATETQVEGVFADGSVFITDRRYVRATLEEYTTQIPKFQKVINFLNDSSEIC